jgi:ABC-2 type transport system ATP-binding protein
MPPYPPDAPPAIHLENVAKRYGRDLAVADLSLTVATTIRLLLGFLRPTQGTVRLLGHNMAEPKAALAARRRLGFVPDVAGLDAAASGLWLLDEVAQLQQQPPVDRAQLLSALAVRDQDLRRPLGRLSRGTRQKINIVQGLQHRPNLLILDEPTEGLDPLAKRALFDLLHAAHARGATIFFSSHVLSEVEELCDRVALIRSGQLAAVARIDDLRAHMQRRVTVRLTGDAAEVGRRLAAAPGVASVNGDDTQWRFLTGDLPATLRLLATLPVADVTIEPPSLEDVFLRYYRAEHTPNA